MVHREENAMYAVARRLSDFARRVRKIHLRGPYFRRLLPPRTMMGRQIVENLSSRSQIRTSTAKARQPPRTSTFFQHRWRLAAMIVLGGMMGLAGAPSRADTSRSDPPSRVARLSYIAGDLGFLPQGARNWSDARINRPLTTGDRLSSGHDARAELELGGGTVRIAGDTDLGLLGLNGQLAQFELTQGALELSVRQLAAGQSYEIDTPTVAVVIDRPGRFRVDIQDGGRATRVTAFAGNATVYGRHQARRTIFAGRRYRFDDSSLQVVEISDIGSEDAFDYWSQDRDRRYARANRHRYVSDQVVGYQDLDRYGGWQTTTDYGAVWFPNDVGSDWAPYRDGHWAYIAPWGWTWVDDLPWGFAPYHYGRWVYLRRGWGWIPGPLALQPVYAPALVVFVGGGWSVGGDIAPIGWFPLGPGEIYNPWYRASRNYYTNINITNINITNIHGTPREGRRRVIDAIDKHYRYYRDDRPYRDRHYVNRDEPHAFTAVPEKAFADGRHVRREMLHLDRHQRAAAKVLPDGTRMRPAAGSLAPPRNSHLRTLPLVDFRRKVVARHPPSLPRADRRIAPGHSFRGSGADPGRQLRAHVQLLNPPPDVSAARTTPGRPTAGRSIGAERAYRSHSSPVVRRPPNPRAGEVRAQAMQIAPDARRAAALPSARYVHPQPFRPMPDRYVNSSGTPRSRLAAPRQQPPRFERAARIRPTAPTVAPRIQRTEPARSGADRSRMPAPAAAPRAAMPGFAPRDRIPGFPVRRPARPIAEPRMRVVRPRFQPAPRAVPQLRPPPRPAMRTPQQRPAAAPAANPRQRQQHRDGNAQRQ